MQYEKVIKQGNCRDIVELGLVVDTQASGLVRITKPRLMSLALEQLNTTTNVKPEAGQAGKGTRWMPWHQGPKKGAARLRKAPVSCQAS